MTIHQLLIQWLLLCVVVIGATKTDFPSGSYGDYFTNMAIHDGKIYIGAKNYIYILNADNLSQIGDKVSTCTDECNNINKVLVVNEKLNQLISCGTEHYGTCQIRSLNDIRTVQQNKTSSNDSKSKNNNYLVVSTMEKRPASFLVTMDAGGLYTGVTYGPGVKVDETTELNSYFYYLSYYSLEKDEFFKGESLQIKLKDPFEDYLVYFKGNFEQDGFVYFVTNQKFKVNDTNYTSKLIRVCDSQKKNFFSYIDVVIECQREGLVYNLIQDISIFEPGEELKASLNTSGKVMAATFAVGTVPENPGSQSAVCLFDVNNMNRKIMEAKKDFIVCPKQQLPENERYLPDNRVSCATTSQYNESMFSCGAVDRYSYIVGNETIRISAAPVYEISSVDDGSLDKIQGFSMGKLTAVHVGTSLGTLYKLNVNSGGKASLYGKKIVDKGHPITGLYVEGDGKTEYVMSNRKIWRYETSGCDMYSTCEATMQAGNPLCGWCVYEQNSTFKDNSSCPYQLYTGHWLSSLTQCLSIEVHPRGFPVGPTQKENGSGLSGSPTVTVSFLGVTPTLISGYAYECDVETPDGGTRTKEDNLNCITPPVKSHTEQKVKFYAKHKTTGKRILLAETDLLFYDCGYYKKCGECVGDDRANCSWNSHTTTCVPQDSSDIFIQQKDKCPKFRNDDDRHYLPSGVPKTLTFNMTNLVNASVSFNYSCRLNGKIVPASRELGDQLISCTLQETTTEKEVEYKVQILYGTSALDGENTVVVYNCDKLGSDCSICRYLKYNNYTYECDWCTSPGSKSCRYTPTNCTVPCDPPEVTGIVPKTSGTNGNITVTISGKELGSKSDEVNNITLAGVPCTPQSQDFEPSTTVTCLVQPSNVTAGTVIVTVNGQQSSGYAMFEYKLPEISKLIPTKGPKIGGTRLTITGQDLGIGTRNVNVYVTSNTQETKECTNAKVMPELGLHVTANFRIECNTPMVAGVETMLEMVEISFEGGTVIQKNMNFTYLENPEIGGMRPLKGIASGGIRLTVTGKKLKHAYKGSVSMTCQTDTTTDDCYVNSVTEMICRVPKLCPEKKTELMSKVSELNKTRRKRDTANSDASTEVEIIIHLDGVNQSFSIYYYIDPSFDQFDEESKTKLFESNKQKLIIRGSNLNLVAEEGDVIVTVGVDNCAVIELRETNLTCVAPTSQPAPGMPGGKLPEVNVSIGNVHANLGYLQYVEIQKELAKLWIIIAAVIGSLLAVVVIVVVALLWKYKQKSKKMRDYQRHVEEQEMEIKQIFREEFADMHTSMLVVNNNLIEQGCPYHHYQQYVFNVLFPADKMESHPLLQEPVVSSKPVSNGLLEDPSEMATSSTPLLSEVTDNMRSKMKRGMEEFESLIFNKYFLMSVIDSLEQQRKFGLKDKANMCGYICTILLGRMEYLQEILVDLLGNLVQESAGKKNQKVLFRRCETITEKLLSNWLSLCLYPHLKSQSGYPLYLLYKATQLHMEAGPIDAITNDAKYTLSEEKLLKKYSQHSRQSSDEPTFEAKCLTLNVIVDNCRDIKVCRVLDCDTITQVKDKCLTQIYVNYPASNLTVKPEELELEWHAGMSGSLRLRDEDNTSKRHGDWVRINTLAHYNVQDGSNMALIDPQVADASQEQDYVNLAQVQVSCPSPSECSIDSTDAVTASLVVDPSQRHVRYWHIVKPEEGTLAPGKSIIAELYLNRLLTFKQSILEYVRAIYDTVLKEDVLPAHVHYLYGLLDGLAKKNNVESDILHTWKSEIYPVRIWASLMKKPSIVFDIKSPPYVDTCMDVISQVFIECFSLEALKFSKDSSTHKMIFNNEMKHYKDRVKQFYKEISVMESQPLSLRKYLEEVNRLQQQHSTFNKMSALHKLYQQIEPYMADVIDDLSTNSDACKLHLDKKLEQINGLMEEE